VWHQFGKRFWAAILEWPNAAWFQDATFKKNVVHVGVLNWAAGLISMGNLEIKGCI